MQYRWYNNLKNERHPASRQAGRQAGGQAGRRAGVLQHGLHTTYTFAYAYAYVYAFAYFTAVTFAFTGIINYYLVYIVGEVSAVPLARLYCVHPTDALAASLLCHDPSIIPSIHDPSPNANTFSPHPHPSPPATAACALFSSKLPSTCTYAAPAP
ncbi:hypothetical protein CIB48_g2230 [Xylaria polymorpha]|nr:hypothetical protein CIB48_g2230 [Xylaria polymorpha]